MKNQSSVPPTDSQHRQVQDYPCLIFEGLILVSIPPTVHRAAPSFQLNMPAHQQDEDVNNQSRSCLRCSKAQRTQVRPTTEYPVEQQAPRLFVVSSLYDDNTIPPLITSLFINRNDANLNQYQNVNNRGETATIVPHRERVPETVVCANNSSRVLIADILT